MPRELEDRAGAGAVNLELVDKRGESYEAPAYTAFSGGGQTLASTNTSGIFSELPVTNQLSTTANRKQLYKCASRTASARARTLNLDNTVAQLDAPIPPRTTAPRAATGFGWASAGASRTPRPRSRRPV